MSLHFIRPHWLWALLPLLLLLIALWRDHGGRAAWNRIIPPHLAGLLITRSAPQRRHNLWLLALSWLVAVLALSGPAFNKQALPVFASGQGRVLVMDMSLSMYATDLAPNRLAQARFRAIDLLDSVKEGETGLIAYAGDAFTISPLTRDVGTLLNLLPTLSPDIMPVLGSNPVAAISQAKALLSQGGHVSGDIILFTDGISQAQFDGAKNILQDSQYRLAILAIGSEQGAAIRLPDGQLQRDSSNDIVVATTDYRLLSTLARENHGILIPATTDGSDLTQLTEWLGHSDEARETGLEGQTWQDAGPYLALLLLLPLMLSFRHGTFPLVLLGVILLPIPAPAEAEIWQDLWQTRDQQAMDAYSREDYASAAGGFSQDQWRASALYKNGDYKQAQQVFELDNSATGLYNQGNSLMQQGKYADAIERYQAALEKQADFADASANLELANKLLQESQQSPQDGQQGDQSDQEQQDGDRRRPQQDQPGSAGDENREKDNKRQQGQDNREAGQQDAGDSTTQGDPNDLDEADAEQQAGAETNPQDQADGQRDNKTGNDARMQAKPENEDSSEGEVESASEASQDPSDAAQVAETGQTGAQQEQNDEPGEGRAQVAASQGNDPLPPEMERALKAIADDPQVLLRNKMQLEYQKRRQRGATSREKQQW